ncbi:hypothetical protein BJ994_001588 [Arthrobacter pigmenti]|uniref:DUF3224 domain-containing protein n=1 Tax=Arthrobacter pigmenti TaxID=271432 RepID=A0A846RPJ6_9MICC|nr:DUF3224 domain-containing protein [Arthrobacter pigmenti]NJC22512.1 hypothetical protein [Arthrobacter pigmenti]
MSEAQEQVVRGSFDISGWEPQPYTVDGADSELNRVSATKEFVGDIEGVSVAELLMAGNSRGAGYVASEVFTGIILGRQGSVIIQHWGLAEGTAAASSGHIIPGSGTGELEEIAGKAEYSQDLSGQHHLELRVTFG